MIVQRDVHEIFATTPFPSPARDDRPNRWLLAQSTWHKIILRRLWPQMELDFMSQSKRDVARILETHKVKLYAEWELPALIHEIATTGKDLTDQPDPAFAERS